MNGWFCPCKHFTAAGVATAAQLAVLLCCDSAGNTSTCGFLNLDGPSKIDRGIKGTASLLLLIITGPVPDDAATSGDHGAAAAAGAPVASTAAND